MQLHYTKIVAAVTLAFTFIIFQRDLRRQSSVAHVETFDDAPGKRAHHSLFYDEKRKSVILTAGSSPLEGGRSFVFYDDVWAFDGKQWKAGLSGSDKRSGVCLAFDSKRGQILSYGGFSGSGPLADLRMLDENGWKTLSDDAAMKAAEAGGAYDRHRDRFIVFGGGSSERGQVNATTWEWDGTSWKKFEGQSPEGRQAFAMVYDEQRKKTILFGGMGATPATIFKDTWEFDGKTWTKVDTTGPSARMSPGFTYDSKRGLFIIFGGMSATGALGDTWGWNGKRWQQLSENGPSARAMGYMAYDKNRDRIVLFGGRIKWPEDANDTWEWNGSSWQQITTK